MKEGQNIEYRKDTYTITKIHINENCVSAIAYKILKNGKLSENQAVVSFGRDLDNMCNFYKF